MEKGDSLNNWDHRTVLGKLGSKAKGLASAASLPGTFWAPFLATH